MFTSRPYPRVIEMIMSANFMSLVRDQSSMLVSTGFGPSYWSLLKSKRTKGLICLSALSLFNSQVMKKCIESNHSY